MDKTLVLYTGGKDSHTALIKWVEKKGSKKDIILLNIRSLREDLMLFHTINSRWVDIHAQLMNMPIYTKEISGEDEKREFSEAVKEAKEMFDAKYLVSGVVASSFQKKILDDIASRHGLIHCAPLWQMDQESLLREEVEKLKISFIIVAAQAMGLDERWVGRIISSKEDVDELIRLSKKYMFSPVGEGGEYESFVISSPLFEGRKIDVRGRKIWFKAGWGYYYIDEIKIL